MARWMRWIRETNETLLDLVFGCLVYSFIFEIAGLLFVENKGSYSLGLFIGTAVSVGVSMHMAKVLDRCLNMLPQQSKKTMVANSILRWIVMLAAAWTGVRFKAISFPGVIIGMLGLKVSAHMHMYTNLYITKKIRRKGR
ncbi:MAG: ATP synthase subunit I [Eubacteriales bacterium]|nr:ATP synthase subunit I [Eubacteriales bacterium]